MISFWSECSNTAVAILGIWFSSSTKNKVYRAAARVGTALKATARLIVHTDSFF
jgi:hypothetical protein